MIPPSSEVREGPHPLSDAYQKRLDPLIGILSRFIVERAFKNYDGKESETMKGLIEDIAEEAKLLIGPIRSEELKEELMTITREYYQEDEQYE
ncbi:MAG: hypothetical protein R6V01_04325 [Thermoplasmatota archaeon]